MSRHQLIEHVQLNKVKFIKQIVGVCHSSVLRIGAIKRNGRELTHLMKDYGEDIKSRSATNNVQPHIIITKIHKQFSSKQQQWESISTNKLGNKNIISRK